MADLPPYLVKKKEEAIGAKAAARLDYANKQYELLVEVDKASRILWFTKAKVLKDFKDNKLYRYVHGSGYETWNEFCSDPVVGISRVTANLHISLYEYFIDQMKLSEAEIGDIPIGRLQRMLPHMDNLDTEVKGVVLAEAKLLSDKDFYRSLAERTGTELPKRPNLYFDAGMQKWVFKFYADTMGKIVNESEDKVIWQHI